MSSSRSPRRMPLQGFPTSVRLIGIGWYFALCIVLGVVGGLALDGVVDSKPAFTFVGLGLGLAAAFYGGYVQLMGVLADVAKGREDGQ